MKRIGIIGTGFGAKIQHPGYTATNLAIVHGIAGKNFNKTLTCAQKYHIPRTFERAEDLINDPDIDIVSLAVPPSTQARLIKLAARVNKPILFEKPLATDLKTAVELARLITAKKLPHAIDFEMRFVPVFEHAKKILDSGVIGAIRSFQITYCGGGRAKPNTPLAWSNYKKFGGGIVLNYGPHIFDYVEWLLGPIGKVSASLSRTKKTYPTDQPLPTAEDTAQILCVLKDKTPGTINLTNVVYGGDGHRCIIYGEHGTLKLENKNLFDFIKGFELWQTIGDGEPKNITQAAQKNLNKSKVDGRLEPFSKLASSFIKNLQTPNSSLPTIREGLRTQKIIEAIKQSAAKKIWTKI